MSKKVRFYLILDLIGVAITFLVRWGILHFADMISNEWLRMGIILAANIATVAVCLFILFFFLLYWWSDIKWTNLKKKFRGRK